MKRTLERILCRRPRLYLRILRALGRGSLEKRAFLSLVRAGDVVCDIGANRGHFTRLFSLLVGKCGAVHAFEPGPWAFARLSEAAAALPPNFTLHACALADEPGTATLHLPGEDDGQASLRKHGVGSWAGAPRVSLHECRVSTLDEIAAAFTRLDFIKCDVEGAELLVVKGGRGTLARLRPLLWLEVNPAWTCAFGYTPDQLVAELRALGYGTFFLAGERVEPLSDSALARGGNLLCAQAARHSDRLAALAAR